MQLARRLMLVVTLAVLISASAYGAGWASKQDDRPTPSSTPVVADEPTPTPTPTPSPEREPEPVATPTPVVAPQLVPGPALLAPGDESPRVRELQARLAQIDWFAADPTGTYGDVTAEAVRGFQAKREIPVTGEVDQRTMNRLLGMTTEPTPAELTGAGNVAGPLDERCRTGRAICVDKTTSTLRWVIDGEVQKTVDARFGGPGLETREGLFHVYYKNRDHVSSLYDTSMPFAMFFSEGQAVHYSPDFAAVGYSGSSHGCVNVRDHDAIAWLFDQVQVGDKVVVYWS